MGVWFTIFYGAYAYDERVKETFFLNIYIDALFRMWATDVKKEIENLVVN